MTRKKLMIFDGSYLIHRSYHGRPPYYDYEGNNCNAISGVKWSIFKAVKQNKPDYVVVTFDTGGKTFRHELSEAYKADRAPLPDDLKYQIPHCVDIVKYEGYKVLDKEGFEGDDVMGSLARFGEENNLEVIIVTGDKDIAQVVTPNVSLLNCFTGEVLTETKVEDKFGVRPDQMADYLALMGDKADGIKGMEGVGKKTASALLKRFDSIDGILERIDELSFIHKKTFKDNIEQLKLDRTLSTICCDLVFDINLNDLKVNN